MILYTIASIAFVLRVRIIKSVNIILNTHLLRLFLLDAEKFIIIRSLRYGQKAKDRTLPFKCLVYEVSRLSDFITEARETKITFFIHFIIEFNYKLSMLFYYLVKRGYNLNRKDRVIFLSEVFYN